MAVLAFSASLPATRLATTCGLDGMTIGAGRAVVAAVLAVAYLRWRRAAFPARADWWRLALVALGVVLGFPILTSLALAERPAANGIVVTALLPAATAIMAVLRAAERPSIGFWAASLAGGAAVVAFAISQGASASGSAWPEALLVAAVLLCGLGYAEGGVLARRMDGPLVISWALVLALPVTLVLTLAAWDPARLPQVTGIAWAAFAYLALVSMFLGFFAWYRGLALGGVARIGQLQLAQPLLSLLWAGVFLDEVVTAGMMLTAVLVLSCVAMTQRLR